MEEGRKPVKTLLVEGKGPPPGYQWRVLCLSLAFSDAKRLLNESQYEHMAMQVRELASHGDPTRSDTLSIDRVEGFFELREKGGPLGKSVNIRLYFDVLWESRVIRILGLDWKKNEGHILLPVKERIARRQRKWNAGDYRMLEPKTKAVNSSRAKKEG